MKIYFFDLDPETRIYEAGWVDDDGKRLRSRIQAQDGRSYVSRGAVRHWFSDEQENALTTFIRSEEYTVEFWKGGI